MQSMQMEASTAVPRKFFVCRTSQETGSGTKHVVFVHLGVEQEKRPKLESCAYNSANFRVPDQDNWQPCKERIDCSRPYDEALHCDLDVQALVDGLRSQGVTVRCCSTTMFSLLWCCVHESLLILALYVVSVSNRLRSGIQVSLWISQKTLGASYAIICSMRA